MADLLEIEVDGEPIDEAPRAGRTGSKWGFPAAIAIAGVLAIAVLVVAVLPVLTGGSDNRQSTTSIPQSETMTTGTLSDPDERVVAAQTALAAWGRFAVSGNVEVLEDSFDTQGPQFQDLVEQSGRISAAPPGPPAYEVKLAAATVETISTSETVVTATVVWARPGEVDQTYHWDIVLRRKASAGWLLWTARSSS